MDKFKLFTRVDKDDLGNIISIKQMPEKFKNIAQNKKLGPTNELVNIISIN